MKLPLTILIRELKQGYFLSNSKNVTGDAKRYVNKHRLRGLLPSIPQSSFVKIQTVNPKIFIKRLNLRALIRLKFMQNFTLAERPLATADSTEFCFHRSRNIQGMYYIEVYRRPSDESFKMKTAVKTTRINVEL